MEGRNKARLALDTMRLAVMPETDLRISMIFTSMELTRTALKTAAALACRLNARIALVVPEVVPSCWKARQYSSHGMRNGW